MEAISDFEKAIELDSTNFVVYSNLGLLYRKNNDYKKAIYCYT
jgi:tetratricopeptide (TPR) repeat protein